MSFQQYVEHGWALCKIEPGQKAPKQPQWNHKTNVIRDAGRAQYLEGAGLCHAYSGTCSLDIDRFDEAEAFLEKIGIDLLGLMNAPDAVQISSGTPNRGKLLYKLSTPLPSKSLADGAFELRCAAANGRTVQDVLPPSVHPSGRHYEWKGDWRKLPEIPEALLKFWQSQIQSTKVEQSTPGTSYNLSSLHAMVFKRDSNCGYEEWIKIGMAVHHETNGDTNGFHLWNAWSRQSEKYPGEDNLHAHWTSFGRAATPVTGDFLRKSDVASVDEFDDVTVPVDDWLTPPVAPAEQAKIKYQFEDVAPLFEEPPPAWIIPGVVPQAGFGAIYGQYSTGKTFVTVDLATSVALGQPWRGREVKQGRCQYIAAEDDTGVITRLASAFALRGAEAAPVRILRAAPVFTSKEHTTALMEALMAEKPGTLTFVDTFASVTPGADENTGKDMGKVLHFCQEIYRKTRSMVIVVHHEGKTAGKGMRGWSGIPAALDMVWYVEDNDGSRQLTIEKLKGAPDGMSYKFRLLPVGHSCTVEYL